MIIKIEKDSVNGWVFIEVPNGDRVEIGEFTTFDSVADEQQFEEAGFEFFRYNSDLSFGNDDKYSKPKYKRISIGAKGSKECIEMFVGTESFLLNNEGKTVQRII